MKLIATALAAMALPSLVMAEGFSTADLGSTDTEATCMSRSRTVFEDYSREVNAGSIDQGSWTSALYDITNDDYDAIIACAYGPNDTTRATLVVYADDGTDNQLRRRIAERIKQIWERYE